MMRFVPLSTLVLGAVLTAGCGETPTASPLPEAPSFGKTATTTAPRLAFQFDDRLEDRIRSDGSGTYSDGTCGVHAKISLGADAVLDPDKNYRKSASCSAPRQIRFVLNGSTVGDGSYVTIHNLWKIESPPGSPTMTRMAFTTSVSTTGCESIRFGHDANSSTAASGGVQVTKTSSSPNTWVVETDANSVAECWKSSGGTTQRTPIGNLPFRLVLTEIQ